ncbi:MAG: hypothetical protein IJB00_01520 [Akkermansia sp.]|nr:hypothetical protein [Akkermansia sp.]
MTVFPLSPAEFFLFLMLVGLLILVCVFIPVQVAAKVRRVRHSRTHITCRICGYRYLLADRRAENVCPHCDSRN